MLNLKFIFRNLPGVLSPVDRDSCGQDRALRRRGRLVVDGGVVRGLRVVDRAPGSAAEVLRAELVVDGSGRGSRLVSWLADLGRTPAEPERVAVGLRYASCRLGLDPAVLGGDIGILCGPSVAVPRTASLARLENGEFLLTVGGWVGGFGDDRPPTDVPGLVAFIDPLPWARPGRRPSTGGPDRSSRPVPVPHGHPAVCRSSRTPPRPAGPRRRGLHPGPPSTGRVCRWPPCRLDSTKYALAALLFPATACAALAIGIAITRHHLRAKRSS